MYTYTSFRPLTQESEDFRRIGVDEFPNNSLDRKNETEKEKFSIDQKLTKFQCKHYQGQVIQIS